MNYEKREHDARYEEIKKEGQDRVRKTLFWIVYVLLVIFILRGIVHFGPFSGLFEFIAALIILVMGILGPGRGKLVLVALVVTGITYVGLRYRTQSSLFFPILDGGYVEILQDGYQETFSDGSGGFALERETDEFQLRGTGPRSYTPVAAGEKYEVTGVRVRYPDFNRSISLITEIGAFSERDYQPLLGDSQYVRTNKPVIADWID